MIFGASLCSHGEWKTSFSSYPNTVFTIYSTSKIQQYSFYFYTDLHVCAMILLCRIMFLFLFFFSFFLASHFEYFLQFIICKFRNQPKTITLRVVTHSFSLLGAIQNTSGAQLLPKGLFVWERKPSDRFCYSFHRCLGIHPDQRAGDEAGRCCF